MFLKKLYTEPEGLFEPIIFKDGLNLIIAHRPPEDEEGTSLNGLGKSTALDLIDFCLLAGYSPIDKNNRLAAAKKTLDKYTIVLEFEVDGESYIVKRSTSEHTLAYFSKVGGQLEEYRVSNLSPIFSDLMFLPREYEGRYYNSWYRTLRHLFVKIHKPKVGIFNDPIEYMDHVSYREFMYLHFFLLGLDNNVLYENNEIVADRKRAEDTKKDVKKVAAEAYGIEDITDKKRELQKIKLELSDLERNIEEYKLSENYSEAEDEANELTSEIKTLWLRNLSDRKKVDELKSSLVSSGTFTNKDINRVTKIYSDFNKTFGQEVKATLEQAVEYRRKLIESRKSFIETQLHEIKDTISLRDTKIKVLEERRIQALSFLTAKKAIGDITEAYLALNRKRNELNEIESIISTSDRIDRRALEIGQAESQISLKIQDLVDELQATKIAAISKRFYKIYDSMYKHESRKPNFSILPKMNIDAKVEIEVKVPSGLSKARNQGRVLVYDLTLLLTMIANNQRGPRFLIHDGVFDGMDPEHFSNLYLLLNDLSKTKRFQYITTLNESEGTRGGLSGPLSPDNAVTMGELIDESILDLTPSRKLLGITFD